MVPSVEEDLYDLALKAGLRMDHQIFKLLLDLISMNCSPSLIARMLKQPMLQEVQTMRTEPSNGPSWTGGSKASHL
nr:unnamed protein product [Spirometra erinaceieuropaei]